MNNENHTKAAPAHALVGKPWPIAKQKAIEHAARMLEHWAKQIVDLGPQGSARYLMLDKLRHEMARALCLPNAPDNRAP